MYNSRYVYLSSATKEPKTNRTSKFKVRLGQTLRLDGAYYCGLYSISYPLSYDNIGTLDDQAIYIVHDDWRYSWPFGVVRIPFPSKTFANVNELEAELNNAVRDAIAKRRQRRDVDPERETELDPEVDEPAPARSKIDELKEKEHWTPIATATNFELYRKGNNQYVVPNFNNRMLVLDARVPRPSQQQIQRLGLTIQNIPGRDGSEITLYTDRQGKLHHVHITPPPAHREPADRHPPTEGRGDLHPPKEDGDSRPKPEPIQPDPPAEAPANIPLPPGLVPPVDEQLPGESEVMHLGPRIPYDPIFRSILRYSTDGRLDKLPDAQEGPNVREILEGVKFVYDKTYNRFRVELKHEHSRYCYFTPQLGYALGFTAEKDIEDGEMATHGVDLGGGIHTLYVYAPGLVENMIVSDTTDALLRIVTLAPKVGDKLQHDETFDTQIMSRVLNTEINEIDIEIRTADNRLFPFDWGNVELVLVFKKALYT